MRVPASALSHAARYGHGPTADTPASSAIDPVAPGCPTWGWVSGTAHAELGAGVVREASPRQVAQSKWSLRSPRSSISRATASARIGLRRANPCVQRCRQNVGVRNEHDSELRAGDFGSDESRSRRSGLSLYRLPACGVALSWPAQLEGDHAIGGVSIRSLSFARLPGISARA